MPRQQHHALRRDGECFTGQDAGLLVDRLAAGVDLLHSVALNSVVGDAREQLLDSVALDEEVLGAGLDGCARLVLVGQP